MGFRQTTGKPASLPAMGSTRKLGLLTLGLRDSATKGNARLRVLIRNDLAVLAAMEAKFNEATEGWWAALEVVMVDACQRG